MLTLDTASGLAEASYRAQAASDKSVIAWQHLACSHKAFADGVGCSPRQLLEQDAGGQLGKHALLQLGKQLVWQLHGIQQRRKGCRQVQRHELLAGVQHY